MLDAKVRYKVWRDGTNGRHGKVAAGIAAPQPPTSEDERRFRELSIWLLPLRSISTLPYIFDLYGVKTRLSASLPSWCCIVLTIKESCLERER